MLFLQEIYKLYIQISMLNKKKILDEVIINRSSLFRLEFRKIIGQRANNRTRLTIIPTIPYFIVPAT